MPHKTACPICRAPTDPAFQPFCSRACRDRDLLAWLGESYRVPARPASEDEAESLPDDEG